MHWYKVLSFCVVLLATTHGETRVELTADKQVIAVKGRVTFTCRVYDLMVSQFVRWHRKVGDLPAIIVATNGFLEESFKNDRYLATEPTEGTSNPLIFTFSITDARATDSGAFQCSVYGGSNNPQEQVSIEVALDVTPQTLSFSYVNNTVPTDIQDGQEVKFEMGAPLEVLCQAERLNPKPIMELRIGKELQTEVQEQYDEHFKVTAEDVGDVEHWWNLEQRLTTRVTPDISGKTVNCSVRLPGEGRKTMSRSFVITTDALPPVLSCPKRQFGLENEFDQVVICNVTTLAAITSAQAVYHRNNKDTPENRQVVRLGSLNRINLEISKDETKLFLRFVQAFRQDFRKYTLTVANVAGNSSQEVQFIRAEALGQYTVNVDMSRPIAKVGENLEVTCTVVQEKQGSVGDDDFPLIVWMKRVDNEEVEIGTNNYVNAEFRKTGRYSAIIDYEYDDQDPVDMSRIPFQLSITGVQPADSGAIGCKIPQQSIELFRDFTVIVPVKSVRLNSVDVKSALAQSYTDGTVETFNEGHVRKFFCRVNGSYPRPQVSITIGDRDITDQFELEEKVMKNGFVKGLQELTYSVTLKNETFAIDYSFSNKRLECKAILPMAEDLEPVTTGITIKLAAYKPKFVCNQTIVVPFLKEDVLVKCRVHADPAVENFRIYWPLTGNGNGNMSLDANSSDGHYHANVENGSSATEKIMSLKIDRVFKQHFRIYIFEAENELGKATYKVELVRGTTYDKVDSKDDSDGTDGEKSIDNDYDNVDNKDDNDDSDGTDGGKGIDQAYSVHGAAAATRSSMSLLLLSFFIWKLKIGC